MTTSETCPCVQAFSSAKQVNKSLGRPFEFYSFTGHGMGTQMKLTCVSAEWRRDTTQAISSSNPEQQCCARRVTIATPSQYLVKKGEKSADIDHTRVILAGRGHVPVTSDLLYCLILFTVYLRAQVNWTAQVHTDTLRIFLF